MNDSLSEEQKEKIKQSIALDNFSIETEISRLMELGYDEEKSRSLITVELKEYKKEMFDKVLKNKQREDLKDFLIPLIIILSVIGPIANIELPLWDILKIIAIGIIAFISYKNKPVAGIIGYITLAILFPFAYNWYLSGRTSYRQIEMLIPLAMASTPAYLIFSIISNLMYDHKNNQ